MKFGFGLITCQRYPGDSRTNLELYREALDLVRKAELLGFDSAWVTEHHFWDDSYMPLLLVFCAAAGALTQKITIGTSVVLAPLYDPLRLAEDAATVDLLSSGRFILGLGQGWMPHEFEALRVPPLAGRHIRLDEAVAKLRAAWSGEFVRDESDERGTVLVTPAPAQPGGPPIWIGAQREPAIRRAARIGDGFISASAFTPEILAEQVEMIRDEAARVGRDLDRFAFSLHRPTFAWHGLDAWENVREYAYYVSWKYEDMARPRRSPNGAKMPPPLTVEREASILGGRGLVARPDEIVEQLLALQEATPGELPLHSAAVLAGHGSWHAARARVDGDLCRGRDPETSVGPRLGGARGHEVIVAAPRSSRPYRYRQAAEASVRLHLSGELWLRTISTIDARWGRKG